MQMSLRGFSFNTFQGCLHPYWVNHVGHVTYFCLFSLTVEQDNDIQHTAKANAERVFHYCGQIVEYFRLVKLGRLTSFQVKIFFTK